MAAIKKRASIPRGSHRVSPLKPGLRGARNWASAQVRAAGHTRKGFMRLCLSIVAVLTFIVFIGLWLGGALPHVKQSSKDFTRSQLMSMGFVIDRVDVMGEGRLREQDVRAALGVYAGDYLFEVNMESAQDRVESLSWVDRAVVRRLWPDRIVVQIIERQPYALWQNEGVVQVVDSAGMAISDADARKYTALNLFVGETAGLEAANIENMMAEFPDMSHRAQSFVHISQKRWDIIFDEGAVRVQFPVQNMRTALRQLNQLQVETQILDRQIAIIDMRLPDRLTLTPSLPERA